MYIEYIVILYPDSALRPPKHHGTAYRMYTATSHRRLGLISWYTTGFQ